MSNKVLAAMIGAIATVVAGVIGALVVVWQIGRQARDAIRQTRHNETLKLKLKVYEEIIATCRSASDAVVNLSSYA